MANAGAAALGMLLLFDVFFGRPEQTAVETLKSVGGLPAHIAGRFEDIGACQRSAAGDYFIFDRRAHAVYSVPASLEGPPKEIVGVGVEPGRLLRPSAFELTPDGRFVIADSPFGQPRVQFFLESGARVGGFTLPKSGMPQVTLGSVVVSGVGSLEYNGRSIFISLPEFGALITEYNSEGTLIRSFGELRATGHEADRDVHLALNTGRIVINPQGGFYYVFLAGAPLFRKYDARGALLFERHIQGGELDEYARNRPTTWPKRSGANEIPLVMPVVRAAAADAAGNLWISLAVPVTYVYDSAGERKRIVQFSAAGILTPTGLSFSRNGRLLATPGCYAFETKDGRAGASR